jgi:hypothetical protein
MDRLLLSQTLVTKISRPNSVRFYFVGLVEEGNFQRKVDKQDEFLARILGAAARIKNREDQFRRQTRDLRPGVTKCTEVDGRNFKIYCEL